MKGCLWSMSLGMFLKEDQIMLGSKERVRKTINGQGKSRDSRDSREAGKGVMGWLYQNSIE